MRGPPAPLRFLIAVTAGWTLIRAAALAPLWPPEVRLPPPETATALAAQPLADPARSLAAKVAPPLFPGIEEPQLRWTAPLAATRTTTDVLDPLRAILPNLPEPPSTAARPSLMQPVLRPSPPPLARVSRLSGYAWLFGRSGAGPALAPGGTLGGSEAGLRLSYRVSGSPAAALSVSARLSAPARRPQAAEVALGLDWRPSRRLPLHLLAERRQKLGSDGRSALALSAYGGFSDEKLGAFRLDAWGQVGAVGARSRDLFADGSVRLSLPLGKRIRVGGGAWGAAQPGVARFDAGPQATFRIDVAGRAVTVGAEWRFRLAGDARPGSGPALSVASGF
jgi:hypothetical protein